MHELITLLWCLLWLALVPEHIDMCWCIAFFYVGREFAQAEYRYIESHGGKRDKCPAWCGFLPEAWTDKGLLDFLFPMAISGIFVLLKQWFL